MMPLLFIAVLGILLGMVFAFGFHLDQNNRRTWAYVILMCLLGGILGLWLYLGSKNDPVNLAFTYMLQQGVFLLLGIFHVWWLYRKMFWSKRDTYNKQNDSFLPELTYTLAVVFLMSSVALFVYGMAYGGFHISNFRGLELTGDLWALSLMFAAPFFFIKCFDFLNQIPGRDFSKKWVFNRDRIGEDNWDWVNETWVNFELKESLHAERKKEGRMARFRISVPRRVPLREVFRLALREYNQKSPEIGVQDLGYEKENTGQFWFLFVIKFIWNRPNTWFRKIRYLDPYASPEANGILPNDIIRARRMSFVSERTVDEENYGEIAMGEL